MSESPAAAGDSDARCDDADDIRADAGDAGGPPGDQEGPLDSDEVRRPDGVEEPGPVARSPGAQGALGRTRRMKEAFWSEPSCVCV